MRGNPEGFEQDRLIVLDDVDASQRGHSLYGNANESTVSEELEYVFVGLDLSLHFVFDLSSHESEFFLDFVGLQISSDLDELGTCILDLS